MKKPMTLAEALFILSKLESNRTAEDWGTEIGWCMNGKEVASGVFTAGGHHSVHFLESKQFAATTFEGEEADQLRDQRAAASAAWWLQPRANVGQPAVAQ